MALFLITAPSGAGKTTIAQSLRDNDAWKECISHTTRDMREGEKAGETYYFIQNEQFLNMLKNNEFAEHVEYEEGKFYGVTNEEINRVRKKSKHQYIIVEYNGYKQIKEKYPDAIGIFLHMSKEDCLANMLLRGDSLEKALARIEKYDEEMKNRDKFDYVVKNVRNKQFATVSLIKSIIMQYS